MTIERLRCVRCGFCASEDLRETLSVAYDTGKREFCRCEVCRSDTTHRVETIEACRCVYPDKCFCPKEAVS